VTLFYLTTGDRCASPCGFSGGVSTCTDACVDERILKWGNDGESILLVFAAAIISYAFMLYVLKTKGKRLLPVILGTIILVLVFVFYVLYFKPWWL
jgi:uncharacterized membrane protein (UPF0136 family)